MLTVRKVSFVLWDTCKVKDNHDFLFVIYQYPWGSTFCEHEHVTKNLSLQR